MGAADDITTHNGSADNGGPDNRRSDNFAMHDGVVDDGGTGNQSTQRILYHARIVDVAAQNGFVTVGPSGQHCDLQEVA